MGEGLDDAAAVLAIFPPLVLPLRLPVRVLLKLFSLFIPPFPLSPPPPPPLLFFPLSVKYISLNVASVGSSHLDSPVSVLKKYEVPSSVSHSCHAGGRGAIYPALAIHRRSLSVSLTSIPKRRP
jgi:hypothetical protein